MNKDVRRCAFNGEIVYRYNTEGMQSKYTLTEQNLRFWYRTFTKDKEGKRRNEETGEIGRRVGRLGIFITHVFL